MKIGVDFMKRLKMAVVGIGVMGQLHARTLSECDSVELVAIVDLNEELGRSEAEKFGVEYYKNVEDIMYTDKADAYSVVLPDRLHVDIASKILLAGKHVLLEKPMADTLEGAKKIKEAARKGNSRIMIGHVMRFDPRYSNAAKSIKEGEIGDIVHVSARRLSNIDVGVRMNGSSSVLFYLGIHDVDALQWITNKKVKKVFARSVSKIMPSYNVESEDAIFANFEYEDGTIGSLATGWTIPDYMPSAINASLEIIGTKGVLQLDTSDHGLYIVNEQKVDLPDGMHWPVVNNKIAGDLKDEIQHFATSIQIGRAHV